MKKLMSLLLVALMVLTASCAFAETADWKIAILTGTVLYNLTI